MLTVSLNEVHYRIFCYILLSKLGPSTEGSLNKSRVLYKKGFWMVPMGMICIMTTMPLRKKTENFSVIGIYVVE